MPQPAPTPPSLQSLGEILNLEIEPLRVYRELKADDDAALAAVTTSEDAAALEEVWWNAAIRSLGRRITVDSLSNALLITRNSLQPLPAHPHISSPPAPPHSRHAG